MKRILAIAALAVVGLVVAVGVTMATSKLSSQSVGISEEPVSAGDELAVPAATTPRTATQPRPPPPAIKPPAPPPPPPAAVEPGNDDNSGSGSDSSGEGRGRGRGRGGDDD